MSAYRLLVYVGSAWIVADGILALLLVYPPAEIWLIIRFTRILVGAILLLEVHRVRAKLLVSGKTTEEASKRVSAYIDLLSVVGIWLVVDGVGTGLLNYTYPILIWQLIRLARVALGVGLALGAHLLWFKAPQAQR